MYQKERRMRDCISFQSCIIRRAVSARLNPPRRARAASSETTASLECCYQSQGLSCLPARLADSRPPYHRSQSRLHFTGRAAVCDLRSSRPPTGTQDRSLSANNQPLAQASCTLANFSANCSLTSISQSINQSVKWRPTVNIQCTF